MLRLIAATGIALITSAHCLAQGAAAPGCAGLSPAACVALAVDALGGRQRLESIHSVYLDVMSHTARMEQSYRQDPFSTSYERDKTTVDLDNERVRTEAHGIWPEADLNKAESDTVLIVSPAGGVYHGVKQDTPCSLADLERTRQLLELGPLRAVLAALAAPDLHYGPSKMLRGSEHAVLVFSWNHQPVSLITNPFNHLPDAIETTARFNDFWYFWGNVKQRVYWDNWRYIEGVTYPSSEIIERNGAIWSSAQALDIRFNVPTPAGDFVMQAKPVQQSAAQKGWEYTFDSDNRKELAPGVDLYGGSWNTTLVRQGDGIVILETPVSPTFTRGIYEEAARKYPGEKIKAVLMTSDSWPHVGGLRFDVPQNAPLYVLDLNLPLLKRLLAAPLPAGDPYGKQAAHPNWKVVGGKQVIGAGDNRVELYPIRGGSTERQYLVYFPEHRLLYASDTLVMNSDATLYDPQLMHEVRQAVEREHLIVDTVFAMHEGPTPWKDVLRLLDADAPPPRPTLPQHS